MSIVWKTCEGGFPELQYLHINKAIRLYRWSTTESDFPALRHLVLENSDDLDEIPSEIGEIQTLERIEISGCEPHVVDSARKILEEQRKYGNTLLQLYLDSEFQLDESHGLSLKFYTFSSETILPRFLRNLTLEFCKVPKTLLPGNESLPAFQVLNIESCQFASATWEPFEGVFCQLQYLKIVGSYLKNWSATESHFPALRHLVIQYCWDLNEIPKDLGRIKTLEMIEVDGCKYSVIKSARIILKEQRQYGNTRLQLRLGRGIGAEGEEEIEEVVETLIRQVENHGFLLYCNFSSKAILSLKKLTLKHCNVPQTLLDIIDVVLPEIQVLKLVCCSFENSTWELRKDGFCQLQYLEISQSNLVNWLTADFPFPVLQHLILYDCLYLYEIPSGIGHIHCLESIEVGECKTSVCDSAKRILEEQRQLGNTRLQLWLGGTIGAWSSSAEEDEEEEDTNESSDEEKEQVVAEEVEAVIHKGQNRGLSFHGCNFSNRVLFCPQYLKRLSLQFCEVPHTVLDAIVVLTKIQFLQLAYCSFESSTWKLSKYRFCKLQYLEISHSNLENWLADDSHFPTLRHLVLDDCPCLDEIPSAIGEISILELIEVDKCTPSLFSSAERVLEVHSQFVYRFLQLRLGSAIDESEKTERANMIHTKILQEIYDHKKSAEADEAIALRRSNYDDQIVTDSAIIAPCPEYKNRTGPYWD